MESVWLEEARAALEGVGVDLCGTARGDAWQDLWPGCRSVVVFGSTGSTLWERALAMPVDEPHPVDAVVRSVIDTFPHHPSRRWVRCASDAEIHPDFRTLGQQAGLGWPSRLGLLIHPTYGPWLGLRAACFTTEALNVDGPLVGPGPCEGCAAPCATACPASALAPDWKANRCLPHRRDTSDCDAGCDARSACVIGRSHAYDPAQHRYHHHPPSRPSLRAAARAPSARISESG